MKTPLVDSHCHLNHEMLAADWRNVLERAAACRVERVVVVGYDEATSAAAAEMAEGHPGVWAAVGIHPHEASAYDETVRERIAAMLQRPRVVALGEIGLDFHYDFSPRDAQVRAFKDQLALARAIGTPVIVHCRDAYDAVLDVLEETSVRGVVHCWSGTPRQAERAVACGLYLGFTGILTFRKAEEVRLSARVVPPDRLLVETDAPYLAPAPHRGARNEPAYLPLVVRALAEVRGVDEEEMAAQTTANAERLFGLASTAQPLGGALRRARRELPWHST